jgi:hypothetical protein
MTQISNIIDRFSTLIEGQVSGVTQIPNPYEPEGNSDLWLNNGYGVGYGSADVDRREVGCKIYLRREIIVMLLRRVEANENDASGVEAIAKNVMEDELKIIKAVENDNTLNGNAIDASYIDTTPLEYLVGDRGRYFILNIGFSVLYAEDLNS